jgi:hypothetical protein
MMQLRWVIKSNGDEVLQFLRDGIWINVPKERDEKKDALENIEQEIIARACRNGVCED